jgi:hypothetical protein
MTAEICVLDGPPKHKRPVSEAQPNFLESYERVVDALRRSSMNQVWVVASNKRFADLVRAVTHGQRAVYRSVLFSYSRPDDATAVLLESSFGRLLLGPHATVPIEDLVGILREEHPEDFCIAAQWIKDAKAVALWRGDFKMLTVPLAWFERESVTKPDPTRLSVEDSGLTIRMGDYEAAFDAVLYEQDAAARKRMRGRMRAQDRTLGGSVWRLRTMRGVRRDEFGEIDEKTIARIERGEVQKPQRGTLEVIASRLGVGVDDLESY